MDTLKGFYSDNTHEYVNIFDNDGIKTAKINLRTPRNMGIPPLFLCDTEEITMSFLYSGPYYDYYGCTLALTKECTNYAFKVVFDERIYYYTKSGLKDFYDWADSFKVFRDFSAPDWAIGAVMYQIFPDRFCNGSKQNDVENSEYYYAGQPVEHVYDWNSPVANLDVARFYGGDLVGVKKKLDYLSDLGIDVIYLNPIFVSPSNHKYDCQDYDHVDPHLTTIVKNVGDSDVYGYNKYVIKTTDPENLRASNEWFSDFVKEVHARGMKIILDGVFNHCGSFNKWMDRDGYYSNSEDGEEGAYNYPKSKYRSFFKYFDQNNPNSYEGWWGFDTLPKLNYEESEDLCEYVCNIGAKWVSEPYNCDGWRLDVAADLGHSAEFNHKFWKRFRNAVKQANPDSIILAEHYGNADSWLMGDEWDTVMNYDAFMEPVSWFFTGMEKHSDNYLDYMLNNTEAFMDGLFNKSRGFSYETMYMAMNELSNHDHSRFLTRTNHYVGRVQNLGSAAAERDTDIAVMAEAVVFQMMWPGCPTVYYGDEAGLCGFTDPDNRRTYPWGRENRDLIELHKELILLRHTIPVIKTGSVAPVYAEHGIFAFMRFDSDNAVVTIINNNDYEKDLEIPLDIADIKIKCMIRLLTTDREGCHRDAEFLYLNDNRVTIHMKAKSACVIKDFDA